MVEFSDGDAQKDLKEIKVEVSDKLVREVL